MANQNNSKRYSLSERRAYYMGVGAWIGFGKSSGIKKAADQMSPTEKQSFYNGLDDAMTRRIKNNKKGR